MGRLEGKVCLVTGAASGIGARTSEMFAAEGAVVILLDCRAEALKKQTAKMGDVMAITADIADARQCDEAVAQIMEKYGRIDVLSNIAGILDMDMRPIDDFTDEDLDRVLNVNLKGTMYLTRAVTKIFETQGTGAVETVASVAGVTGNGSAAYCASKGALIAMTKNVALRFANKTPLIRANCVCPGTVWTPMTKKASAAKEKYGNPANEMMDSICSHTTMNVGICKAVDVANTLLFLASDESRCMTGQVITLDCGCNL